MKKPILLLLLLSLTLLSCDQKQECEKIIYEIHKTHCDSIAQRLKLENFEKVIVVVGIDHEMETTDLCFQSITDEDRRYNELYYQTNRFLRISDTLLIPAISSEDIVLTESKYVLNRTGCDFQYRAGMVIEPPVPSGATYRLQ